MATLTVQNLVKNGELDASYVAAAGGGDEMPNDERTILHVKNGGGGGITVTIAAVETSRDIGVGYGPYTRANVVSTSIAAADDRFLGPFGTRAFNNANGRCAITYSGVTSVTVAALRLPT